jgi:hypothetical protein
MSNLTENRLNQTLAAADITAINTAIAAITAKLPAGSLDEEQRKKFMAIDVDNKVFCEDVVTEMNISGVGILPPFLNTTFIQNDLSFCLSKWMLWRQTCRTCCKKLPT